MSPLNEINSIKDFLQYLRSLSFDDLSAAFAYLLAPGAVLLVITAGLATGGDDHGVSLVEMQSSLVTSGSATKDPGVLVLLEGDTPQVGLRMKSAPDRVSLLSIPYDVLERNLGQIRVDEYGIELRSPILGASQPLVVLVKGELDGEVLLPGKRVDPRHLRLRSRSTISLAIWCLLPVMVGMGLVIDRYSVDFRQAEDRRPNRSPSSQT